MGKNSPVRKTAQSVASDAAVSAFITWLITQLATKLPFLAFPGVGWIIGLILTPILQNVVSILLTDLNIDLIGLVVAGQKDAYDAAVTKLGIVINNPATSAADQAAAVAAFKADFGSLIHSGSLSARAVRRAGMFQ